MRRIAALGQSGMSKTASVPVLTLLAAAQASILRMSTLREARLLNRRPVLLGAVRRAARHTQETSGHDR